MTSSKFVKVDMIASRSTMEGGTWTVALEERVGTSTGLFLLVDRCWPKWGRLLDEAKRLSPVFAQTLAKAPFDGRASISKNEKKQELWPEIEKDSVEKKGDMIWGSDSSIEKTRFLTHQVRKQRLGGH